MRTFIIESMNIDVIRYKNEEVEKNIKLVLKQLSDYINKRTKKSLLFSREGI